jgi:hypothetical protein
MGQWLGTRAKRPLRPLLMVGAVTCVALAGLCRDLVGEDWGKLASVLLLAGIVLAAVAVTTGRTRPPA